MRAFTFLFLPTLVVAQVHEISLKQAIELSLKQNPDVMLTRLDEQKAIQAVHIARDPFTPRITVGSGLAYSSGFPMSIEGAAPSIVQARASQFIFNRQQSYVVAQAREEARGAGIATSEKRDEIIYRTTALFLDVERATRLNELAGKQIDSLEKVRQAVQSLVQEGRVLPIEGKKAALSVAKSRQIAESLDAEQEIGETVLATVLGFSAEERVRTMTEERQAPEMPANEEAAIESAIQFSKQLRRLESGIVAKGLQIRGERAARLPRVDLVAQYGLFAKFNHYEDYFRTFSRHNGQLGISFQLPVLPGPGISAAQAQLETDIAKLRIEMNNTRNRIITDARQTYREIRKAQTAHEVARLDLDVARDQVSVNLALQQEGRASLSQVEESRATENSKWIAYYDAQYALEKARWNLARQTGNLLAALR
jgi:outer membrane protein